MSQDRPVVEIEEADPAPDVSAPPEPPTVPARMSTPPRRRRWLLNILLGLLIFGCGAVTGAGVTMHLTWKRISATLQHPEQVPEKAAQRLTRVLRLDEKQSVEVKTILERPFQNIAALRSEIAPRMDEELQSIRDEVSAVLRPDQVKRWERLFDALRPHLFGPGGAERLPRRSAK